MEKTEWRGGCLVFLGSAKTTGGHGTIGVQGAPGGKLGAHRVVYEYHHGPIPDGLLVRHKCDNPPCVWIEHLELGTHQDNFNDARERGRWKPTPPDGNNRSTLTKEDIPVIRELVAAGVARKAIAKWFGISKESIDGIAVRRRWGWVE